MSLSNRPKGYEPTAAGPPPTEPPPKPGVAAALPPDLREAVETVRDSLPKTHVTAERDYAPDPPGLVALALIEQRLMEYERVVEAAQLVKEYDDAVIAWDAMKSSDPETAKAKREASDRATALNELCFPALRQALAALSPKEKP